MSFKQWSHRRVKVIALACLFPASAAEAAQRRDRDFLVDADWRAADPRDDTLRIVAIRRAIEYRTGHIPTAVSIPNGPPLPIVAGK